MSEINYEYKKMHPFKWFILENFPFLEDSIDVLTNYQLFCKLGEEINKNRDSINEIGENESEVVTAFNNLYDYVHDYFSNLDVQEEINEKLDNMVDTGELTSLIGVYIQPRIDEQNSEIQAFKTLTNDQIATQNQNISNLQNSTNSSLNNMQTQLNSVASGSPLVASSTSDMTNTSKIYVNTTDGKWYYYDGDSWEIGGTYQASGIADGSVSFSKLATDTTFNLNSRINDKDDAIQFEKLNIDFSGNLIRKNLESDGTIGDDSTIRVITNNLYYIPAGFVLRLKSNTNNLKVSAYYYDKDLVKTTLSPASTSFSTGSNVVKLLCQRKTDKYVRFWFAKTDDGTLTIDEVLESVSFTLERNKLLTVSNLTRTSDNLLNIATAEEGFVTSSSYAYQLSISGSYKTQLVPITSGKTYFIYNFRKFALYNTDLVYVANSFIDSNTNSYSFTASADGYMAISWNTSNNFTVEGSSGNYDPYIEKLPSYVQLQNIANLDSIVNATNILYGKKYVALGDSFTHGDFTNSPTDDYTFDSGTYSGEYKVYPFIIGDRNIMTVVNLAVNGMTITNIDSASENYLSNSVLANIPEDTDYITIKIGINDDHQNAPIGNIDDNISSTFYGSWNRVMNYLITNYPNTKIGIIVSNGISNVDYINATINIAKKYGIAYINESTDNNVPLLIRTLRTDVADSIKSARNTQWEVYPPSNAHPNAKCHAYESTIIENFLRSL